MSYDLPRSSENKDGFCLDSLIAIVEQGPVWIGSVPSKSGTYDLIDHGLAIRTVLGGEEGFIAATMAGVEKYKNYYEGSTLSEAKANRIVKRTMSDALYRARHPS